MSEGNEVSAQEPKGEKLKSSGKRLSKKQLNLALVVVAILLIAVAGGFYWFGTKIRQDEAATDEQEIKESAEEAQDQEATPSPTEVPTGVLTPSPTPSPSPTPTPTPTPKTETLSSSAALDGFRASNGGGNAGIEIRTGRNVNLVTRGFVSFGTAHIPEGATVEKATLRLYQTKVMGDPYGVGIRVKVDHLDYGDSLENADYAASSISGSFVTLSESAGVGWKEVDVTDAVRSDRENNRERSQFRLHFAVENTGGTVQGDFAYFESADNSEGTGNTPQLMVTYIE